VHAPMVEQLGVPRERFVACERATERSHHAQVGAELDERGGIA